MRTAGGRKARPYVVQICMDLRIGTMSESTAKHQLPQSHQSQPADVWERWAWIWSAVFFVSLLVPFAIVMLGQPQVTGAERVQIVVLTGLLALWHLGSMLYARRVPNWRSHTFASVAIILVGIALWYLLVRINSAFYFTLAGFYSQIFFMLPPVWAIPVSVGLGVLVLVQGGAGSLDLRDPGLWAAIAGIGFSVIFYIWIAAIIRQSAERKDLIDELAADAGGACESRARGRYPGRTPAFGARDP